MWVYSCVQLHALFPSSTPGSSSLRFDLGQYQMPPTPCRRYGVTTCGVLVWCEDSQVISRVPQEAKTSFNEEASLQAMSDTCHNATGQGVRGVLSSAFWRFFECEVFLQGFYTGLGGFPSHSQHKQHENFWVSVWVSSGFSGEFLFSSFDPQLFNFVLCNFRFSSFWLC